MSKTLIVGLGNPGDRYAGTRHNIGFDVVDLIASEHDLTFRTKTGAAPYAAAPGSMYGRNVVLIKPLTYMNRSGDAVAPVARFYKTHLEALIVIHDDIDIPLGRIRFMRSGGHGGHNGVRSIIQSLGSSDFPRLKIGINRPQGPMPVDRYVLSKFSSSEIPVKKAVETLCLRGIECYLKGGIDAAMNEFNGRTA